jgi:(2Fe-2S) ferredoxin
LCAPTSASQTIHAAVAQNSAPTRSTPASKQEAKRLNLKGIVRANKAGCLDYCAQGPSVVVYPEGIWYRVTSETDVKEIMERHIVKGEVVERLLMPDQSPRPLLSPLKA